MDLPVAARQKAEYGHDEGEREAAGQRYVPAAGGVVHPADQWRATGRQQITDALRHA
ncbi:hypothetical protein [Thauera humireducens]|uniref:hypothetical protein n=1 Tax=Thauera humireducens TaxID=1134435 RepID=UPI00311F7F0D